MISGLSGETGRASPSGSGALGDEALCLPLLVDAREGPWEPEAAIRPSSGAFGLPVARTANIRPSLVRMYVPFVPRMMWMLSPALILA